MLSDRANECQTVWTRIRWAAADSSFRKLFTTRRSSPAAARTHCGPDLMADLSWAKESFGLRLVRLLATGADEIFDGFRCLGALSLLEFVNPGCDSIHHITGPFAASRLVFLPVHALSALDHFYFLLRHKHKESLW